jgi:hypothetical protein
MTGPAHLPVLKAQHPAVHSRSDAQREVMNLPPGLMTGTIWLPAPSVALTVTGPPAAGTGAGAWLLFPVLTKPQPAPRSRATSLAAHRPVSEAQQPSAQSASLVQGPVMNWVPWAATRREKERRARDLRMGAIVDGCVLGKRVIWWWLSLGVIELKKNVDYG